MANVRPVMNANWASRDRGFTTRRGSRGSGCGPRGGMVRAAAASARGATEFDTRLLRAKHVKNTVAHGREKPKIICGFWDRLAFRSRACGAGGRLMFLGSLTNSGGIAFVVLL